MLTKSRSVRVIEAVSRRTIKDNVNLCEVLEKDTSSRLDCTIPANDTSWVLKPQAMDKVYGHAYYSVCTVDEDNAYARLQVSHSYLCSTYLFTND
jgi:hypothetical protein